MLYSVSLLSFSALHPLKPFSGSRRPCINRHRGYRDVPYPFYRQVFMEYGTTRASPCDQACKVCVSDSRSSDSYLADAPRQLSLRCINYTFQYFILWAFGL